MSYPPQRLSFVTIGVNDLEASKNFYIEKFGWQPIDRESDGILFFQMNGLIFALFPVNELAADAGIVNNGAGFKRFTLAINCFSEVEVDEIFASFSRNGVEIVKTPEKAFWAVIADMRVIMTRIFGNSPSIPSYSLIKTAILPHLHPPGEPYLFNNFVCILHFLPRFRTRY